MRKPTKNYLLDVAMGFLALLVGLSALLLWVVLPQGYFPSRLLWLELHKWSGLALSVAVVLHVVLHGKWLVRMTRRMLSRASQLGPITRCPPDRFVVSSNLQTDKKRRVQCDSN